MKNTNENRRLYWVETQIKSGDLFQEWFTFDEKKAFEMFLFEITNSTDSELKHREIYVACAEYIGSETDAREAFYDMVNETGCFDYDILYYTEE